MSEVHAAGPGAARHYLHEHEDLRDENPEDGQVPVWNESAQTFTFGAGGGGGGGLDQVWFAEFSTYPNAFTDAARRVEFPPGSGFVGGKWLIPVMANASVVADVGIAVIRDAEATPVDLYQIEVRLQKVAIAATGNISAGELWAAVWSPEEPVTLGPEKSYQYLDVTSADADTDDFTVATQSAGGDPIQAPKILTTGLYQISITAAFNVG